MISAMILPATSQDGDAAFDDVVRKAIKSGLVACNAKTGKFRIAYFPVGRVPAGWARMGLVCKSANSPLEVA